MRYLGNYTRTDLRSLDWLDGVGLDRPNREAARFGLELARLAYDLDLAPWLAAGWTDISILAGNRLFTGLHHQEQQADVLQQARNLVLPYLARGIKGITAPLKLVTRPFRQGHTPEGGSAVVMLRQVAPGRFVVALGLMGTGRRLEDWLSNLRFDREGHFYKNFLAITSRFEQEADNIRFPAAARTLGLETLSLRDAFLMAGQEESPVRFVVAGHSRGAAIMQIWAYRRVLEGLLPRHLLGFGFASPKAAEGIPQGGPRLPLHHFLVEDDVFTRVGLKEHLGTCFSLPSDAAFKAASYGELMGNPLFLELREMLNGVGDTGEGLLFILAYLEALSARSASGVALALDALMDLGLSELPLKAEEWAAGLLDAAKRRFRRHYREAAGSLPNIRELEARRAALDVLMDRYGAAQVSAMLVKALQMSHRLVGASPETADLGAYSYLVVRAFDRLRGGEAVSSGENLAIPAALPGSDIEPSDTILDT